MIKLWKQLGTQYLQQIIRAAFLSQWSIAHIHPHTPKSEVLLKKKATEASYLGFNPRNLHSLQILPWKS